MRWLVSVALLAVLFAFVPLAPTQEKPKDQKDLSPSDVTKVWNGAVAKRDMKIVAKVAAKGTPKLVFELIQQQTFLDYQGETKIIHEEISGDRAVVVFRLENHAAAFTPEIRYDVAVLVREDGQWKVSHNGGGVLKEGKQAKR
jgi:hypothetical protein